MRASLLALALFWLAPSVAPAQPHDPPAHSGTAGAAASPADPETRWHLPRKRSRDRPHDALEPDAPDWNPLSGPDRALKGFLKDHAITLDVDAAFYGQFASETETGKKNLGTFAWQSVGDWRLLHHDRLGTSYIQGTFLGSPGLDYDTSDQSMSANVGAISGLNSNVFPDPAAMDELFWKQVSPGGRLVLLLGHIDQSFYFDIQRLTGNPYRDFFALAFENNLSIPFAPYGGVGALVRFEPRKDLYVMAGGVNANDEPWAFWKSVDNGNWSQLVEMGFTPDFPALGKGHYRITPWHNHLSGSDGWGVGLSFDQELGLDRLVALFRFGIGDDDVTAVERFVSGGLAFERPFGRKDDAVALGVAWSDPSPGAGMRNETLLELYYRLSLSPSIALTPDLQIVLDPANNAVDDTVVVGGVRLHLSF